MPSKGPKKAKAETTPEPKPTPKKQTPVKKPKEPVVYKTLERDTGAAIPIDVIHEGQLVQAKLTKAGTYSATLKLEAPSPFSLVKTVVFPEGHQFEGYQAILLRPAKAFPFLKLPKEVRARMYGFYFAQKGVVGEAIALDGKRANKDIYSKTYAESSKNRVALLATNKEIHKESIQIFYAHTLKLESTTTLLDFLSQIPTSVRSLLKFLDIKCYIKTTSRNAMHFLADSKNLNMLRIESGIFGERDPQKAAKTFYADAYKFLESIGAAKGDKTAGVDVLDFGKQAFTFKDDKKDAKPWADVLVEEFRENLRNKLK